MAENKTKPSKASVDKFIANIENPRRLADARVVLDIYKEVTGFPPLMWGPSIIGFGTFYVGDKFEGAQALFASLGKHRKSVACLYVNKLEDVDLKVLREIIARDFAHTTAQD